MTTRRATELALAIGSTLMIAGCGTPIHDRIALVGVTVIDGTDAPARDDQVVIIRGSKIDTIAPAAGFNIPKTAMVVDLKGKWVIPGLIDVDGAVQRWAIPRYLAFGVTTVRDVGNDQDSIVALAEAASLHSLVSPRLFVTGAALDGTTPFDPSSVALTSESAARRAVDDRIQGSATFVSVGPGLTPAILRGVVDEASSLNTAVTARLGLTDARTAAKLGIKSLLELSGVPQSVVDPAPFYAAFRRSPWNGWTGTERAWAGLDSAPLGAVATELAATGVTLVPALVLHDTWSRLDDSAVTASPDLTYVPAATRAIKRHKSPEGRRSHFIGHLF
ncbi:MAG: amidohydrolase family protein, partial [Gemmatimonadales bacterium]